jgi:trehalose/maltose hydrolase-like predicted phosphorylase
MICANGLNHDDDDANDKWLEIANKIKVIHDEPLDYHPQFEGYQRGTKVKQADAVLIGYPLMFPMNESTRRNDLNFYANCTRANGPAMTYSMFAINYHDIGDARDANAMLERSYKPYIRGPFNVWCETAEGDDDFASNFITGAGGFLQAIFNGFLGIRVHVDCLEIRKPSVPKGASRMKVGGFSYMNSRFEVVVKKNGAILKFTKLSDALVLTIDDGDENEIIENFECEFEGDEFYCEFIVI